MKRIIFFMLAACTVVFAAFTLNNTYLNEENKMSVLEKGNAPEFPPGLEWLNTDNPLKLSELKGKIVLLDFWTYCCINCMHIIPDLRKLEEKYKDKLIVIGVHSAKFLTEQGTNNIREAILRYGIEHPVVNDKNFAIWKEYDVHAWPTVVLIDPDGNIVAKRSGENVYEPFNESIKEIISKYDGKLNTTQMQFALENDKEPKTLLSFPGKVTADEKSNRLFITDSNHNRIIVTDLKGNIVEKIGSGKKGKRDGSFNEAEFYHPQGTAVIDNFLYVADTENNLIRKADLKNKTVETIAGNGERAANRYPSGDAKENALNSPWDLTITGNQLFIAMAGTHQIWAVNLDNNNIRIHAGTGRENIEDGNLASASLAQPSGITTNGKKLYFADSEVSAVRSADINPDGKVKTIIGHGLFDFGDIDGDAEDARFQHPLGIVYTNTQIFLADTYNNKIKIIDPVRRISKTFAGTGDEGKEDGNLNNCTFDEPGGIAHAYGKLYVADTNNDLIRVIDIMSGEVSTLKLKGMEKLQPKSTFSKDRFDGKTEKIDNINLSFLKEIKLHLKLPEGHKINPLAQSQIKFFTENGSINFTKDITSNNMEIKLDDLNNIPKLFAEMVVYFCKEGNEGLCRIDDVLFEFSSDKSVNKKEMELNYSVK